MLSIPSTDEVELRADLHDVRDQACPHAVGMLQQHLRVMIVATTVLSGRMMVVMP